MTQNTATASAVPTPAALRRPILNWQPEDANSKNFQEAMLDLADLLDELRSEDEDDTLEGAIISAALHAFPGLIIQGPPPGDMVERVLDRQIITLETFETLCTLSSLSQALSAYQPPGLTAAMWRAMLLAIFRLIELFVMFDDDRGPQLCIDLLDSAEAMAAKFTSRR